MNTFKSVNAEDFIISPFKLIGQDWMLISAEKDGKVNTMTASWGGLGVLWDKNVAYIFVRHSRYTKEFLDAADSFSLSFLDHKKYADTLSYLGSVSGRRTKKIVKAGLTVAHSVGTPYFDESSYVIFCKKLCRQPIEPSNFLVGEIDPNYYEDHDYHDMYIGQIMMIVKKEL